MGRQLAPAPHAEPSLPQFAHVTARARRARRQEHLVKLCVSCAHADTARSMVKLVASRCERDHLQTRFSGWPSAYPAVITKVASTCAGLSALHLGPAGFSPPVPSRRLLRPPAPQHRRRLSAAGPHRAPAPLRLWLAAACNPDGDLELPRRTEPGDQPCAMQAMSAAVTCSALAAQLHLCRLQMIHAKGTRHSAHPNVPCAQRLCSCTLSVHGYKCN